MAQRAVSTRSVTVRRAMDRVLAAEKAAQDALNTTRQEARQIAAEARETARRISERTQERISRIHAACERRSRAEIKRLKAEAEVPESETSDDPAGRGRVTRAAARVASYLTRAVDGEE